MKKTLLSSILLLSIAFSLSSCGLFHEHVWANYLEKAPTCSSNGMIKRLCLECGELEYEQINTYSHNYVQGRCRECGAYASTSQIKSITIPTQLDHSGSKSLRDVYDLACTMGCELSYSKFISSISNTNIGFNDARVNSLGLFRITATLPDESGAPTSVPLSIMINKISLVSPYESVGDILRADLVDGEIVFTYKSGEHLSGGFLNGFSKTIEGFGVSKQNELVIYYSDNTLAFAGKVSS